MTPAETIQAAIVRLEQQRDAGAPGTWNAILRADNEDDDAALIVTLHRTIDPQLAILREAERVLGAWVGLGPIGVGRAAGALSLARAILGDES